jgi:hypothetical protein
VWFPDRRRAWLHQVPAPAKKPEMAAYVIAIFRERCSAR